MQSNIHITNSVNLCSIDIEGVIGVPEEWQFDDPAQRVATYERFKSTLDEIAQIDAPEVVINIRSTGGDVNDALLIHDALVGLDAKITTRCYGYTASAATIIAQAGSEGQRQISSNALYLIHSSSCATEGNAAELEAKAELLKTTDEALAALYAKRCGGEASVYAELMAENGGAGRWLTAQEVVELGLADALIEGYVQESSQKSEGEPTNLAKRWRSIKSRLGFAVDAESLVELPQDHNVLHFEQVRSQESSQIAFVEGQNSVKPTSLEQREDPSVSEIVHTANQRAYADDARRFVR